jgi:putative membrane protein
MRFIKAAVVAASVALVPGTVAAQTSTTPSTQGGTQQPPVAGANSFTEAQAKDRIEKAGYANVTALKKDDQGIWRASAKQGEKQVNVALDFQGNVVANP